MTDRFSDMFPTLQVPRGGIRYDMDSAEAKRRRGEWEALQALIARWVGDVTAAQHAAIDAACWDALVHGWDVHVQRHWSSRFVGIELAERERPRPFVLMHEHPVSTYGDRNRWSDLEVLAQPVE